MMHQQLAPPYYLRYSRIFPFSLIAFVLLSCFWISPVSALPAKYQDILKTAGFSDSDVEQVAEGKLLRKVLESSNEREIAMSFAFLTKATPADIEHSFLTLKLKKKVDPAVNDYGLLSSSESESLDVSQSGFDKLNLGAKGDELAKELISASPDGDLNLSQEEIASFGALEKEGDGSLTQKAQGRFRQMLLARYLSYREKGLAGILPYARAKNKNYNPGEDLLQSLQIAKIVQREAPIFYSALLNYPAKKPEGLSESFSWVNYDYDGKPNISLVHRMGLLENGMYIFSERRYYNLRSYNSLQGIGGAFPCDEHRTAIIFSYRTITDQVAGFGGSTKRAVGVRMMGNIVAQQVERFREEQESKSGGDEIS